MAEKASKVQDLIDKGILNVAYSELQKLTSEVEEDQYESDERLKLKLWLRERI